MISSRVSSSPFFALALAFFLLLPPACSPQTQASTSQTSAGPSASELNGKACLSVEDAVKQPNKDVCVSAHVFDVVQLSDGMRFLDVCPPETADENCHFTFVSPEADRKDVGDLTRYRDQDVHIRGIIRATHGRMGIVISHMRQFRGGPEKFRPNPRLVHGFEAESDRPPVRDPNLSGGGHHRSFMNTRDTESLPVRSSH